MYISLSIRKILRNNQDLESITEMTLKGHSMSSEMVKFDTALAFCCNYGSILYRFQNTARYRLEISNFPHL